MLSRFSHVRLFATAWTVALARQAPLSVGFSRQEYWGELPCPPPGDLLKSRMEPASLLPPALAGGFVTTSATAGPERLHGPWKDESKRKEGPAQVFVSKAEEPKEALGSWWLLLEHRLCAGHCSKSFTCRGQLDPVNNHMRVLFD